MSAFVVPQLRHQRVLQREGREPGASSEERGPTPALHPAQRPPCIGDDKHSCVINNARSLQLMVSCSKLIGTEISFCALLSCPTGPQYCVARLCQLAAVPSWKQWWFPPLKSDLASQSFEFTPPLPHAKELSQTLLPLPLHPPQLTVGRVAGTVTGHPSQANRCTFEERLGKVRKMEEVQEGTAKGSYDL